jgi:hypothetical protein
MHQLSASVFSRETPSRRNAVSAKRRVGETPSAKRRVGEMTCYRLEQRLQMLRDQFYYKDH